MTVGLASTSNAQNLTFDVLQPSTAAGLPANSDNFLTGVTTNSGDSFTAVMNLISPMQTFSGDSSVSFGFSTQTGPTGSGTFTAVPANFSFDLTVPSGTGSTKSFQVLGQIDGTSSFDTATNTGASNAFFSPVSILVDGVAQSLIATSSPAGRNSLEISGLNFGTGIAVDVFFDQRDALTAPGPNNPLTVGGFVRSSVPEPGTVAMLVGMGVSGSAFLLRKRRRA